MHLFLKLSLLNCNEIKLKSTRATGLTKCKTQFFQDMKWEDSAIFCNLHMTCNVSGSVRGTNTIDVEFPDNFQNIKWSVSTSVWYSGNKYNMSGLASSFGPSDRSKSLIGTTTKPTKLSFGVIRSKFINNIQQANKIYYGIQMSYLGLTKEENELGTDDGKHHVAFEFDVEESVYVKEHSDKVVLLTRIASMFALLLSAMSGMKFFKTYSQLIIDTCFFKCKKRREVPGDVLRRERVLDEHNLTAKGTRRLSSVGNVLMGLKNMQDINKNKAKQSSTSSEIEMSSVEGEDKKKHRSLMTQLGFSGGQQNPVYSNPLKKNTRSKTKTKRSNNDDDNDIINEMKEEMEDEIEIEMEKMKQKIEQMKQKMEKDMQRMKQKMLQRMEQKIKLVQQKIISKEKNSNKENTKETSKEITSKY